MRQSSKKTYRFILSTIFVVIVSFGSFIFVNQTGLVEKENRIQFNSELLQDQLSLSFLSQDLWPEEVELNRGETYLIDYSFHENLQTQVEKLLKRYRSDYSAIVVIDNETGKILAASGYNKKLGELTPGLAFTSTHPPASLLKIVTAASLLENTEVTPVTAFHYNGRGTTLYKNQLKNKKNRWTRKISFEKAFAYSNNVVFGKAAINYLSSQSFFEMAHRLGFNQKLFEEIKVSESLLPLPDSQYNLAELASGFSDEATISPVHAALIPAVVANGGQLPRLKVVDRVLNFETHDVMWQPPAASNHVFSAETAEELRRLMGLTVTKGTARGSFRRFPKRLREHISIGGKTGSITGGLPHGKRDWFIGYAIPKDTSKGKGISVSVMNVNVKKWYVKSAFLARLVIQYYYSQIEPVRNWNVANEVVTKKDVLKDGV